MAAQKRNAHRRHPDEESDEADEGEPSIDPESGLSASPIPAKTQTPTASQPIHRRTTLVFRIARAYIGTTTPQSTTSPV